MRSEMKRTTDKSWRDEEVRRSSFLFELIHQVQHLRAN